MFVIPREMQNGAADDNVGKRVRERHLFDVFNAEIFPRQRRDRLRVLIDAENFIAFINKINEIAPIAAAGVENAHPGSDASAQELVEQINIDGAELLLQIQSELIS